MRIFGIIWFALEAVFYKANPSQQQSFHLSLSIPAASILNISSAITTIWGRHVPSEIMVIKHPKCLIKSFPVV